MRNLSSALIPGLSKDENAKPIQHRVCAEPPSPYDVVQFCTEYLA